MYVELIWIIFIKQLCNGHRKNYSSGCPKVGQNKHPKYVTSLLLVTFLSYSGNVVLFHWLVKVYCWMYRFFKFHIYLLSSLCVSIGLVWSWGVHCYPFQGFGGMDSALLQVIFCRSIISPLVGSLLILVSIDIRKYF